MFRIEKPRYEVRLAITYAVAGGVVVLGKGHGNGVVTGIEEGFHEDAASPTRLRKMLMCLGVGELCMKTLKNRLEV